MENIFNYKIYKNVYEAMISGRKSIEIRLLNEKSAKIQKGDKIHFSVLDSDEQLEVIVTNKYIFTNFSDLWKNKKIVLNSALDYSKEEFINLLKEIYGPEQVDNSKLVGIEFKVV